MKLVDVASKKKKNRVPDASAIRIVLIDDHELFRAGIGALIRATEGLQIVGDAGDRGQAIDGVKRHQPNVILLNVEMKYGDGLEMVPELLAACPTSRLAVLTDSKDPETHRRAIVLGAVAIISKDDPSKLLTSAIQRIHAGGVWLDRSVGGSVIGGLLNPNSRWKVSGDSEIALTDSRDSEKITTLTEREREVIRLVGMGLKTRQIGERLFISDITVHHHLTSIYSKLELKDKVELLIYAYRHRLAELPR